MFRSAFVFTKSYLTQTGLINHTIEQTIFSFRNCFVTKVQKSFAVTESINYKKLEFSTKNSYRPFPNYIRGKFQHEEFMLSSKFDSMKHRNAFSIVPSRTIDESFKYYTARNGRPIQRRTVLRDLLFRNRPYRQLTAGKPTNSGRSAVTGRIVVRGKGGGVKRMYRFIDFRRREVAGLEGTVLRLEYDPNRSAWLALVRYSIPLDYTKYLENIKTKYYDTFGKVKVEDVPMLDDINVSCTMDTIHQHIPHISTPRSYHCLKRRDDFVYDRMVVYKTRLTHRPISAIHLDLDGKGLMSYIIAPDGLKPGDKVTSGVFAPIMTGNALPLSKLPSGCIVHNIEIYPNHGGLICRSAGTNAVVVSTANENGHVTLRLRSGEVRQFPGDCMATIGRVSNVHHSLRMIGRAGIARKMNRRPMTRGIKMNAVDHPNGGKSPGGKHNKNIFGKKVYDSFLSGKPMRRKNRISDSLIIVGARKARRIAKGYKYRQLSS